MAWEQDKKDLVREYIVSVLAEDGEYFWTKMKTEDDVPTPLRCLVSKNKKKGRTVAALRSQCYRIYNSICEGNECDLSHANDNSENTDNESKENKQDHNENNNNNNEPNMKTEENEKDRGNNNDENAASESKDKNSAIENNDNEKNEFGSDSLSTPNNHHNISTAKSNNKNHNNDNNNYNSFDVTNNKSENDKKEQKESQPLPAKMKITLHCEFEQSWPTTQCFSGTLYSCSNNSKNCDHEDMDENFDMEDRSENEMNSYDDSSPIKRQQMTCTAFATATPDDDIGGAFRGKRARKRKWQSPHCKMAVNPTINGNVNNAHNIAPNIGNNMDHVSIAQKLQAESLQNNEKQQGSSNDTTVATTSANGDNGNSGSDEPPENLKKNI